MPRTNASLRASAERAREALQLSPHYTPEMVFEAVVALWTVAEKRQVENEHLKREVQGAAVRNVEAHLAEGGE